VLNGGRGTCEEFAVFSAKSACGVVVAGLVEVLGTVGVLRLGRFGFCAGFCLAVLDHDLLDATLHHAEVLFGVDVFGLGLVLHVFHLADVSMLLLVAVNAVIDAGGGAWRVSEQLLKLEDGLVVEVDALQTRKDGVVEGVVIEREVVPPVRVEPREIEVQRPVQISHLITIKRREHPPNKIAITSLVPSNIKHLPNKH
jgi:hypothetical protein